MIMAFIGGPLDGGRLERDVEIHADQMLNIVTEGSDRRHVYDCCQSNGVDATLKYIGCYVYEEAEAP